VKDKKRIPVGSSLDDFLRAEGLFDEIEAKVSKEVAESRHNQIKPQPPKKAR